MQIKKVGFKNIIVASFSHMTRLGDTFIRQLHEKGEDFTNLWAFSEFLESVDPKTKIPDTKTVPIGLRKMKDLGINRKVKYRSDQICQNGFLFLSKSKENLPHPAT